MTEARPNDGLPPDPSGQRGVSSRRSGGDPSFGSHRPTDSVAGVRRNLIIAALLALLVLIVQLVAGQAAGVVALSTVLAFGIALGVLAISDRFGRKD